MGGGFTGVDINEGMFCICCGVICWMPLGLPAKIRREMNSEHYNLKKQ